MTKAAIRLIKKNLVTFPVQVDIAKIIPSEMWQPYMPPLQLHHGTFNPTLTYTTPFFIKSLSQYFKHRSIKHTDTFCDMMTGSGIIAYALWLLGARHITAVDISISATATALKLFENIDPHQRYIQTYQSNLFEHSELHNTQFNYITINPPLLPGSPDAAIKNIRAKYKKITAQQMRDLKRSIYDKNYQALRTFLDEAPQHLKKQGKIIIQTSDWARFNGKKRYPTPESLFRHYRFTEKKLDYLKRSHGETYTMHELSLR